MPDRSGRHLTACPSMTGAVHKAVAFAVLLLLSGVSVSWSAPARARLLSREAREAFARYTALTEARNEAELGRGNLLLWIDTLPDNQRRDAYQAVHRGEVKLEKLDTRADGSPIRCPGCLIHHWVGVAFISGAKVDDVLSILEDYDQHSSYYAPDVERSKLLAHDGHHFRAFLRFRRHKVITIVLNTEHDIHYVRDGAQGAHSRSSATRIAEVENAGKSDEKEKAPGDDGGFLWGMETWWRMEERDGGVYVQSEVASLTRDIPAGLGWMIGPFVNGIPKETLTFTLEATRRAVVGKRPRP